MIKFENPENARFYYLKIEKDMLNDLVLSVIFGGSCHVRYRVIMCGSEPNIQKEITKLCKRRIRRGYVLLS